MSTYRAQGVQTIIGVFDGASNTYNLEVKEGYVASGADFVLPVEPGWKQEALERKVMMRAYAGDGVAAVEDGVDDAHFQEWCASHAAPEIKWFEEVELDEGLDEPDDLGL